MGIVFIGKTGSRGGGAMLAVHNSIPSRLIDSPSDIEAVAIHLYDCNYIVCAVYV